MNLGPHVPKRLNEILCGYLCSFLALFTRPQLLFCALNSTVSECSRVVCGQICGQKTLLDQGRYLVPCLIEKRFARVSVWGIVTLWEKLCKSFLRSRRISFWRAIIKEKASGIADLKVLFRKTPGVKKGIQRYNFKAGSAVYFRIRRSVGADCSHS